MNTYHKLLLFIRAYLLKLIDELDSTRAGDEEENKAALIEFIEDVKTSREYENISNIGELEIIYCEVTRNTFISSIIRTGLVNMIMSVGRTNYDEFVVELSDAYAYTSRTSFTARLTDNKETAFIDSGKLLTAYQNNPWLVFILLVRQVDLINTPIDISEQ